MNRKKFIKLLIIALSILTIMILILLYLLSKQEKVEEEYSPEGELILEENGEIIYNFNEYSTIKSCISTLLLYKSAGNNNAVEEITDRNNILENLNISANNIVILDPVHRVDNVTGSVNFISFKFYKQTQIHYGIVILDYGNKTFTILESTEKEYNEAIKGNVDSKYKEYIKIEPKTYNKFKYAIVSEEDTIKEYFKDYMQKALYYPQEAYEKLNKEYREKRFGSIEKFGIYLQEKRAELESLDIYSTKQQKDFATTEEYANYMKNRTTKKLAKYQTKRYDNYTEYTCIDDYGNYYIFKITGAMQYEVLLDEYTIDSSDFIAKYNSVSDKEKAILNVNKFLRAVQDKNYEYAYSKLSEDYKQNYFKTEELFKAYVQANWLKYEDITNVDVEEENGVYKCKVNLQNGTTKQFIMKLNAGTDFVMSFTV